MSYISTLIMSLMRYFSVPLADNKFLLLTNTEFQCGTRYRSHIVF